MRSRVRLIESQPEYPSTKKTAPALLILCLVSALFPLAARAQNGSEPEEPDYAFITGGPYTQQKNSLQLIAPGSVGWRTFPGVMDRKFTFYDAMLRVEWGFTSRLELDLEFPSTGMKEELDGATLNSEFGFSDALVGLRYRLLTEENSPITLTVGPQIIFPTGDFSRGTGLGSTGVALDLSAAKDWGGPFFLYSSLNYALFPSVDVPPLGLNPATDFALGNLAYGTALGIRALEKPSGEAHHDLHAFLELGVERSEELEFDLAGAFTTIRTAAVFAPGIRYGFLSSGKKLFEVGVAVPIGLNGEAPRAAVIFQVQFEQFVNF